MSTGFMRVMGASAVAVACAGCAARAVPFEQGADRYTFAIAVYPVTGDSGAFGCVASVSDPSAKRSIGAPAIEGRPGTPGHLVQDDPESGARLEVDLVVDEVTRLATCSAVVKKGGLLVASDAAKLPLR